VAFNITQGGMFMWGRLQAGADARDLLPHAIEEKVTFVPGDIYYADQADARTLRLSFATPSAQQIEEGVARIGRAVSAMAR
jgi:2-aminoadipate transaminase